MSARILRIELRRSVAVWAAASALLLGFSWASVAEGMTRAMGEQRSILINIVPLAMGVGAWQARRERRSRTGELLATTSRPEWQRRLHPAAALGLSAVTGYLVAQGGLVAYGLVIGAYMPAAGVAAGATAALCLTAGVWLGLALGRVAPWALVPPLLVVGGFVALVALWFLTDAEGYAGRTPPGTLLLYPLDTTGSYAFERLTTRALLAQLVWAAAIAGAFLLLSVARRFRLAAVVPVGLGLALALALLPSSLHDAITVDRGALALVCDREEPRVCARRIHPRVLVDLRGPGQQALDLLAAKLPQAPTRVVEASYGHDLTVDLDPRADTLYVDIRTDGTGHLEAAENDILWTLLMGAGTLPCEDGFQAGAPRYTTARLVAAAWLLAEEPPPPADPEDPALADASVTRAAYDTLLSFPPDEQRARVAALREAELACDSGDRLDILVGDGGAP